MCAAWVERPAQSRARAERRETGPVAGDPTSKPTQLWQASECLDAQTLGGSLPRARPQRDDPLVADNAGCHRPLGSQLETRQALDRPGLRVKKSNGTG
jgi:hypothetical protein